MMESSKLIKKLFLFPINKYIDSFKKNSTNTVVKKLDFEKNLIFLYARGFSNYFYLDIFNIIFDIPLLSTIEPELAVKIGYQCGLNYQVFLKRSDKKLPNYIINNHDDGFCTILSCDRNKNITFKMAFHKEAKIFTKKPEQIISKKYLINNFHPLQACYIGLLAGIVAMQSKKR